MSALPTHDIQGRRGWAGLAGVALLLLPPSLPAEAQEPDTLSLLRAAELALETHPSLGIARQEEAGARASVSEARAARLPSLYAQGSLTRFQEPMVVAPFHGFDLSQPPAFDRTLVQGGLSLGYTLFDGGARSGRIDGAEAMGRSARAGLEQTRMEVLQRVVERYVEVLTAEEILEAHHLRVRALEEERDRAERLFDEGAAPRVEPLRARASLGQARADASSAGSRARVARRELARITGLPEDALVDARLAPLEAPLSPEDGPGLPGDRSDAPPPEPPELQAARNRVAAAESARNAARASWIPDLEAAAGYHEFGSGDGNFKGEWQVALRISYPLFTGGARSAAGERADAELRQARESLALTRLRTRSEDDRARSALEDALARTEALEGTVVQLEEVARIEALALDAGSGVQRDLLAAEASLLEGRAQLFQARHAATVARAALARIRGELTLDWIRAHLAADGEETSP